jgi:cytochrome c
MLMKSSLIALASIALSSVAFAEGAGPGAKVFNRCKGCHTIGPGATNRVGPPLNGIVGRTPGKALGYEYSEAMTAFGAGHIWDEATLATFLTDPRGLVSGTKMSFPGLRKPQDVADLVTYLKTYRVDGSTDSVQSAEQTPK